MNITKSGLIDQLVEKGYTKKASASIVNDFAEIITENLGNGNSVTIRDFGCFDLLKCKERSYKNLQTGEIGVTPEHWVPRFYPSKKMKQAVKEWEDAKIRGIE